MCPISKIYTDLVKSPNILQNNLTFLAEIHLKLDL